MSLSKETEVIFDVRRGKDYELTHHFTIHLRSIKSVRW